MMNGLFTRYVVPRRVVALMMLCCIALCWPLWDVSLRECDFPEVSLFLKETLFEKHINRWFSVVLLVGLFLCLFWPNQKWLLGATLLWLIWMCMLDINRLQPWVWMSVLAFAVAWCAGNDPDQEMFALRLLLAGIYFWSGFNKISPYFAEGDFTWFLETFAWSRPLAQWPVLGYGFALFELFFAIGLLWPHTRRGTAFIVIGFHLTTVFYLGPLGRNWNQVVIPWNLGMAILVYALFAAPMQGQWQDRDRFWRACFSGMANRMVILWVWIAPVFHFWGYWPHGLSWELYTNTQTELTFYKPVEGNFATKACDVLFSKFQFEDDRTKMLIEDWATNDLKVPQFVAETSLRIPARHLCNCIHHDSAGIYVLRVRRFDRTKEDMEWIPCSKLK
jgi:hypothetical protein